MCDLFAVAGYDNGFAAFDGAEEFGESGFGFGGLEQEHGVGILSGCCNYIGVSGLVVGFRISPERRRQVLNWQPSTKWSKKLGLVSSSM